jgi:hypothetical protein
MLSLKAVKSVISTRNVTKLYAVCQKSRAQHSSASVFSKVKRSSGKYMIEAGDAVIRLSARFGGIPESSFVTSSRGKKAETFDIDNLEDKLAIMKCGDKTSSYKPFFNLTEIRWIAQNKPESLANIENCELHMQCGDVFSTTAKLMNLLPNLKTLKTDSVGIGLSLKQNPNLQHLIIVLPEGDLVSVEDLTYCETNFKFLKSIEILYLGQNEQSTKSSLTTRTRYATYDFPKTLEVFKMNSLKSVTNKTCDLYRAFAVYNFDLESYPKMTTFSAKDHNLVFDNYLPPNLKYVKCNTITRNCDKELQLISYPELEHLECESIKQKTCYDIIRMSPNLKVLKVDCGFDEKMMATVSANLKIISIGFIQVCAIKYIPQSCEELVIEEVMGVGPKSYMSWPKSLKKLTIKAKKTNPLVFQSLPSTLKELNLPNDNSINDTQIVVGMIPDTIKRLIIPNNLNVTTTGLTPLINRGCVIIADTDRNEKNIVDVKTKLRHDFSLFLKNKL